MHMIITKFAHSCLLVENTIPQACVGLFDPGMYSTIKPSDISRLDDILITHNHPDHMDVDLIKQLITQFPNVRISAPVDAAEVLAKAGIENVSSEAESEVAFFEAPHETIKPLAMVDQPLENGIHYLGKVSAPGDSHHFL